ncbi:unnamed protein product [Taenia asiatica]|uniref:Transmembrane protein n=1 Tax=Taenia asiatica TaxID=60517 RepID=A0A158R9Q0_TAEAS|nr:unnamed protein product [Taenia asiatica]
MPPSALGKLGACVGLQVLFVLCAFITFRVICHIYVPNLSSLHEIHLGFVASEKARHVFSTDDFSLSEFGASFFTPGQDYKIEFVISIPDSPENRDAASADIPTMDFPTFSGRLILETTGLRWYAATLTISAVLNPLLWFIYQHIWFVGLVFVVAVTLVLDCLTFCGQMLRRYHHRTDTKPLPPQISKIQMNVGKKAEDEGKEDDFCVESISTSVATKE